MHLLAAEIGVPRAKRFVAWLAEYRKPEEPITIDDDAEAQCVKRHPAASSSAQGTGIELFDPEAPVRLEAQRSCDETSAGPLAPTPARADERAKNSCNESSASPLAAPPWRVAAVPPPPPPACKEFTVPPPPPLSCEEFNDRPDLEVARQESSAFHAAPSETAAKEEQKQADRNCARVNSDVLPPSPDATSNETSIRCTPLEAPKNAQVRKTVVEPGIMHLSSAEVYEHSCQEPKAFEPLAPPTNLHQQLDLGGSEAVAPPTKLHQQPDLDGSQAVASPTQLHDQQSLAAVEQLNQKIAEASAESAQLHDQQSLAVEQPNWKIAEASAGSAQPQLHDQQSLAVEQLNQKIAEASAESAQLRAELAAFKKHLAELVCTEVSTITRSRSRHYRRSPSSCSDRSCHPRQDSATLSVEGRCASPTSSAGHTKLVNSGKMRMHHNRSCTRSRSPAKPSSPVKMRTHPKKNCPHSCSPKEDPKTATLDRHAKPTYPMSAAKSASPAKIQGNHNRSCPRNRSPGQFECSQWSELGWAGPGAARRSGSSASSSSSAPSESPKRRCVARRTVHPSRSRSQSSQEEPPLPIQRLDAAPCAALLKPREALAAPARSKVQPALSPSQASSSRSHSRGRSRSIEERSIGSAAGSCSPERWRSNSRSPSCSSQGRDHKRRCHGSLRARKSPLEQSGRDLLHATSPLDAASARAQAHLSDRIDRKQASGLRGRLSLGGA
eukprot:TRINITY_DN1364_c0_g1_i1.p1 TRINITY_DN1364_c0_g1~~TRINITY_DN1364_c0_g1_i1.p1  ORF type:complete len:724 (-),score=119.62 TRINITY_DN1364_c0_g1_i1:107-2278(-)